MIKKKNQIFKKTPIRQKNKTHSLKITSIFKKIKLNIVSLRLITLFKKFLILLFQPTQKLVRPSWYAFHKGTKQTLTEILLLNGLIITCTTTTTFNVVLTLSYCFDASLFAEMTSKICGNSPASLQVSHRRRKKNKKNKQTNFRVYVTHE